MDSGTDGSFPSSVKLLSFSQRERNRSICSRVGYSSVSGVPVLNGASRFANSASLLKVACLEASSANNPPMMTTAIPAKDPAATNMLFTEDEDDFCAGGLAGEESLLLPVDEDLGEDLGALSSESRDFSKSSV